MKVALAPEAELLLLSAGGAHNDDRIRELASASLHWQVLAVLAERERALPVLWKRLERLDLTDKPPPDVRQRFVRSTMVAQFGQEHLARRLEEAVVLLNAAQVEVVLLKGSALVHTVYPSWLDRPMGDVDLLVAPSDARRAQRLLLDARWMEIPSSSGSGMHADDDAYRDHQHLRPLVDARGTGVGLEIHRALFNRLSPFLLSADDVRRESRQIEVGGVAVGVPAEVHHLLHMCIHFAWGHMMGSHLWRTLSDLNALLAGGGTDWDVLVREARSVHARSCSFWTLHLGRQLAGVPVPEGVLKELRPLHSGALTPLLTRHLASSALPVREACPSRTLQRAAWELAIQPAANGHGSVRPWDVEIGRRPPVSRRGKWQSQLANLGQWGRYLRAVVVAAR